LNAVENQTSTTLNDLVEAIPKAGPIIQGLGGTVQDLALYLTAMREGGVNASEGANALKSALASLINPTNVAKDKFLALGISLESIVNNNAGNTTATILELQSALDALNPLQKQQALEQLFGKFQFARMNALFENLGRQGSQTLQVLDLMKASSQDLSNLAGRELAQVTESASGRYRRALEGLKADLASVGDQFLNINTQLINFVDGILKFVNRLPDPIKKVLGVLGMFTAAAGPLIMLTGVLGNFFGYIIKGVSHMRALFKGGEGFKLLTPEILAAQRAGDLVEKTFYSDAKAAAVLKQSIAALSAEFTLLQQRANSAAISVNPAISTAAGNVIIGGQRVVDPNNPRVGKIGTRAAGHHNPVSIMDANARVNQTIHSFTPQPIPVNNKIGAVPQIFADGDLPKIEGLTTSRGVSTGIVAGEAAKHHALMGTLSMLSKRETAELKNQIKTTGSFSTDINTTFAALVPEMTKLTTNAARQSAAIVQQLQAGKITMEAARAKIIAINAQLELMMGQATTQVATSLGRTANLTQVPLINQPIVSPKGKANIKEIFRKGRPGAEIIDRIARVLGVKTYGAGYSTETTIPKMKRGGIVPGTGNTDTYPTTLPEGSFVVNKQATAENMDTLGPMMGMNNGGQVPVMLTPGEAVIDPATAQSNLGMLNAINGSGSSGPGYNLGGGIRRLPSGRMIIPSTLISSMWRKVSGRGGSTPKLDYEPKGNSGTFGGNVAGRRFSASTTKINKDMETVGVDPRMLLASIGARGGGARTSTDVFLAGLAKSGIISKQEYKRLSKSVFDNYARRILSMDSVTDKNNPIWSVSNSVLSRELSGNPTAMAFWREYSRQPGSFADTSRRSSSNFLNKLTLDGQTANFGNLEASGSNKFYHAKEDLNPFTQQMNSLFNPQPLAPMQGRFNTAVRGIHPNSYSINSHSRMTNLGMPLKKTADGWANPRYLPPDPNSVALTKKWRSGYNRGGMVSMPPALPVPPQNGKYNMGGMVQGYNAGGMIASTLLGLLGSQGGAALGSRVGGDTGSMIGGMLGFAAPGMLMAGRGPRMKNGSEEAQGFYGNKLDKSMISNTKFGASLANTAAQGSKVSKVLMGMVGILTKTNIALTVAAGAVYFGVKAWKSHNEALRLNTLSYGLTAEAAQKAGVKFVDYNAKIKDSINNVKMVTERNKLMYESMKSAGLPIQMTIEQYKKLRKEVKSTMSDYVKMIDSAKDGDLASMAERLKTQFVAAGMSADEAAKKIYIAFTLSNKSAQAAVSTVGNVNFNKIIDAQTAAVQAMESFNKAATFENSKTQATALNTALQAVDGSLEDIVTQSEKKAKADKTGKTEVISRYEAEKQMLNGITSGVKSQKLLTSGLIDEMAKQNPLIRDFATTQDTVLSLWMKMRLAAQGYTGDLTMGAQQAKALYTVFNRVAANVETVNKTGALKSQYKNLETLNAQLTKAQNAAKGQSVQQQIDSKKAIEAIDARIKKIKEEADARRKALTQTQQDEDFLTQIKKKQLEYQDKLASGDMSGAAQAQLDIQSLNRQQQVTQATRAIDDKEAADTAREQKIRDGLTDKEEKLANKAAIAAESIGSLIAKINKQKEAIDTFNAAVTNLQVAIIEKKKDISGESAAVVKSGEVAGIKPTESNKVAVYDGSTLSYREKSPQERAKDFMPKNLTTTLNADKVYVNAREILDSGSFKNPTSFGKVAGLDPAEISRSIFGRLGANSMQQKVEEYASKKGIKPGEQFTIGSGNKADQTYKDYQFRVREDGTVVLVKKFAAGGMVSNRPLSMPKFNKMGMGGPVVNSVPRYNSGGFVSSSKSSSSSVIIQSMPIHFAQAPNNPKEFFAQIEEMARQKGIKVMSGGRTAQ
jgi:hypothetical protein